MKPPFAIVSAAERKLPEYDEDVGCPDHPLAPTDEGFGHAGGGYGRYTHCSQCGRILTKTQEAPER